MDFKRLLQDDKGTIAGLTDDKISQFICLQRRHTDSGKLIPCIFLLKTAKAESWHRFFLDTGICYWDEYDQLPQDDLSDPETYPLIDLGLNYRLIGLRIISIDIAPRASGVDLKITLSQDRKVEISTRHPEDDTRLEIGARSPEL
jgi:hypothetical protein